MQMRMAMDCVRCRSSIIIVSSLCHAARFCPGVLGRRNSCSHRCSGLLPTKHSPYCSITPCPLPPSWGTIRAAHGLIAICGAPAQRKLESESFRALTHLPAGAAVIRQRARCRAGMLCRRTSKAMHGRCFCGAAATHNGRRLAVPSLRC